MRKDSITINCTLEDKTALEALALSLGFVWGDRGNISALIQAIACGEAKIEAVSPKDINAARIRRLQAEIDRLSQ
jgi:hypothetical protein